MLFGVEGEDIMAYMMYSADEAIDSKFVVTKNISNQAKRGTLIHIMDASQTSNGVYIDYRVTGTNQDFTIKFDNMRQFCKWIQPDSFIARHYEYLSQKDIMYYMRVTSHGFFSFCLPLILITLAIIWGAAFFLVPMFLPAVPLLTDIIAGAALSVFAIFMICFINKKQKVNAKMRIWNSVAGSKWGIKI